MNDNYPTEAWYVYSSRHQYYILCDSKSQAKAVLKHSLDGDGNVIRFAFGMPEIVSLES